MYRSILNLKSAAAFFLALLIFAMAPVITARAAEDTQKITVSMIGKYDSADTAAIRSIDTQNRTLRLRNHSTGKTYTLSYDNTSMMYDARGVVLSASLLYPGEIVDVTFLKSTKHVTTLKVNTKAWTIESTRDHELVRGDGTARIKGELYKLDSRTLVMAGGNLALAEDILATDSIKVSGIDKEVYSIVVTGGHGYVSLSSDVVQDQSLVGAWLELDNVVIHRISPNMLLSAPEGEYKLQILGNGANYQSDISISRNQETVVDTSNVDISKPEEGLVTFEITPDSAEVFVDGTRMLTGVPQSVRYGYHNLKIMAEGYVTQNKYLKVGTAKSVVRIEMEKEETTSSASVSTSESVTSDSSAQMSSSFAGTSIWSSTEGSTSASAQAASIRIISSNSSSGRSTTSKEIEGFKIYFDRPSDAEVYFDGAYVGQIPTSVAKISGSHEVILKQDGYETKSYRISIDSEEESLNYTFPELKKIHDDDDEDDEDEEYENGSGIIVIENDNSGSNKGKKSSSSDEIIVIENDIPDDVPQMSDASDEPEMELAPEPNGEDEEDEIPEETEPEETIQEEAKPEETTQEETKPEQATQGETAQEETKPGEVMQQ